MIQHIEILDATAGLGATPSTPASAILVPWNPDDSWKRDALLRVNAVLAPPTRSQTVYEHVDVMFHPLGVHLVESIAQAFWVCLSLLNFFLEISRDSQGENATQQSVCAGVLNFGMCKPLSLLLICA